MKPVILFASMFIWAVVILITPRIEPEASHNLLFMLGGGAVFHLVLLGSQIKKRCTIEFVTKGKRTS